MQKVKNSRGWREVKLGEIATIMMGQSPKSETYNENGEGLPFYQGVVDFGDRFVTPRVYCSTPIKVIQPGDILLSVRAPVGRVNFTKEKCSIGRGNAGLRHKDKLQDFLFYVLRNFEYKLHSSSSGSVFSSVSKSDIERLEFLCPPLSEQKAIAEILSSLDDKIDLLHRQNKTLENMAQTLFRKWFVEDAKEQWREVELGSFVKCTTGHSYRSTELQPSSTALVTLKNFARDGSFRMDGYKEFVGKFKDNQVVKEGDLVVSHTDITQDADIIGNPALVVHPKKYDLLVMTMDLMKVESTEEWLSKEFLFYLFKSRHFKSHCLGCSNGTTVLHMSRKAIPSYIFNLSDKEKIKNFTEIARPNIDKIFSNISAIGSLENLRDILLPKLMNGIARVNNFSH